jgi:hypothetical protein
MGFDNLLALGVFVSVPIVGWLAIGRRPLVADRLGMVPIVITAGMTVWSVPILGLLILRSYSPALLGALGWLIASAWVMRIIWVARHRSSLRLWRPKVEASLVVLVAGLAVAGWLYAAFASDTSIAARDMGVYAIHGTYMAEHGRLDIPYSAELGMGRNQPVGWLGFPGVYRTQPTMTVQFGHLYPAWLAQAFGAAGFGGLVRFNAALALVSALAVFAAARTRLPASIATLATLLVAFDAGQVYVARTTLTEILTQLLVWCGFLLLIAPEADHRRSALVWSGVFLGMAAVVRIDSLVLFPLLMIGHAIQRSLDTEGTHRTPTAPFYAGAIPVIGVALAYYAFFSTPYFNALESQLLSIGAAALIGAVIYTSTWLRWVRGAIRAFVEASPVLWLGSAAVVVLAAFAYFVRPSLEPFALVDYPGHSLDGTRSHIEDAMRNLGAYLGPPVVWLAVAGWLGATIGAIKRHRDLLPLVVAVGGASALYFWNQSIFPDHFWAIRRFVPVIIPAAAISAGIAGWLIMRRLPVDWRRWALALATVALAAQTWRVGTPYFFVHSTSGAFAALERFADAIPDDRPYLGIFTAAGSRSLGAPLDIALGQQILPLAATTADGRSEAVHRLQEASPSDPVSIVTDMTDDTGILEGEVLATIAHDYEFMASTTTPVPSRIGRASLKLLAMEVTSVNTVGVDFGGHSSWIAPDSGFWAQEFRADEPVRWTSHDARLTIPVLGDHPVGRVSVSLAGGAPSGSTLRLFVNGQLVEVAEIAPGKWTTTVDIPGGPTQGDVELRLVSDTFTPSEDIPDSTDQRELGVLVRRIVLLSESSDQLSDAANVSP